MGYFCDSECGQLRRVALAAPVWYRQTDPINRRQEREALGPPVDRGRLVDEHEGLRRALVGAGVEVVDVEPHPDLPYLLNLRDTAVVLGDDLVACQMGEVLRGPEPEWVITNLGGPAIPSPARGIAPLTLEGGDVFQIGGSLLVGVSQRTSREGAVAHLGHLGREIHLVELEPGVLHLDTVFNVVGGLALIADQGVKDVQGLARLLATLGVPEAISVSAEDVDDFATNFLCVSDRQVLIGDTCAPMQATLDARGIGSTVVAMSEHHRIGGSVRCATLVLERELLGT
ncbi:MAG TPA: arginine deiminase family protein [Acidimicrobiales bacterium]|nr:arginine deiminase family protein [Acidimicrobiales bacterium]